MTGNLNSGVLTRNLLLQSTPAIQLLCKQRGDGVSFDIFNGLSLKCPVIFTTACDEYAIHAFKVNRADYLLKPVKDAEPEAVIAKCRQMIYLFPKGIHFKNTL